MAGFVGGRLPRYHGVALDFPRHLRLGHAGIGHHIVDGLLTAPTPGVQSGINHQPHRPEHFCLQSPEVAQWVVVVQAHVGLADTFRIQGPALSEGSEGRQSAQEGHVLNQLGRRDLKVMARCALVDHQGRQFPPRVVLGAFLVDVKTTGSGAVQSRGAVVATWKTIFPLRGNPHDFQGLGRNSDEELLGPGHDLGVKVFQVVDHFRPAGIGVGELLAGVCHYHLHTFCEWPFRNTLLVHDGVHFKSDPSHLFETGVVDFVGAVVGRGAGAQPIPVDGIPFGQTPDTCIVVGG